MSHLGFYDARSPHLKADPLAYPPGEDNVSTHLHLLLNKDATAAGLRPSECLT